MWIPGVPPVGLGRLPVAHRLGLLQLVQLLEPAIGPSLQPWSVATSLMLSQEMITGGDSLWGGCGEKF